MFVSLAHQRYGARSLAALLQTPAQPQSRPDGAGGKTVRIPIAIRTLLLPEVPVSMAKSTLRQVPPPNENRTVQMPRRLANAEYRRREYLTPTEVERLMKAVAKNRQGHRDATMILVCYRHGLRVSELVSLEWTQIDFTAANLHVRRLKGSTDAVHPIRGDELRALRRLHREQQPKSAFMFISERGSPFSTAGILRMVSRAGKAAKISF